MVGFSSRWFPQIILDVCHKKNAISPLISNHIAEVETVAGQRLDTLRTAIEKNATKMMRLLSRLSFLFFCNTCFVSVALANCGRKRGIGW